MQGKKGTKSCRINMAFTPENHEYIKTVARASGLSITEFVNTIIASHRTKNNEIYENAKNTRDKVCQ